VIVKNVVQAVELPDNPACQGIQFLQTAEKGRVAWPLSTGQRFREDRERAIRAGIAPGGGDFCMPSFYERTEDAAQTLKAWVAAREAAIELALKYGHALLEDLAENSTLYRSRMDKERIRVAATYLDRTLN
jgi:hypothetical protein